jgi:predicted DCC family thiol-disulfide oxidoreductase YuxK
MYLPLLPLADMSPLGTPVGLAFMALVGVGLFVLAGWLLVRGLPRMLLWLMPQEPVTAPHRPVLYFDGVCGLCNHAVDFILLRDKSERFLFAALQGDTAAQSLGRQPDDPMDTLVLVDAMGKAERSTAALRIAWHLGGIWRLVALLRWVPSPLRDAAYDQLARVRYRLFGQKETCRMPTPGERARFLP